MGWHGIPVSVLQWCSEEDWQETLKMNDRWILPWKKSLVLETRWRDKKNHSFKETIWWALWSFDPIKNKHEAVAERQIPWNSGCLKTISGGVFHFRGESAILTIKRVNQQKVGPVGGVVKVRSKRLCMHEQPAPNKIGLQHEILWCPPKRVLTLFWCHTGWKKTLQLKNILIQNNGWIQPNWKISSWIMSTEI